MLDDAPATDRPVLFRGNAVTLRRAGVWAQAALLQSESAEIACQRRQGFRLIRSQSEFVNMAGGYLVPDEIATEIIAMRDMAGVFRRDVRIYNMGSERRLIPKRSTPPTAYFVGENSLITESQASWSNVGLTARKVAALTRISNELMEDAAPDLGGYLIEEVANAIASIEDACGFVGDGSPAYGGMVGLTRLLVDGDHDGSKVAAATGHDTFAEIDAADITALMARLPEQFWPASKFYCSSYAAAHVFIRLGATTAGTTMTGAGRRPQLVFMGIPVVLTPLLPTGSGDFSGAVMLLFGDLRSSSALGSRTGLIAQASDHRYLELDQTAIRVVSRFDCRNHAVGNGSVAGAVVGLVGD